MGLTNNVACLTPKCLCPLATLISQVTSSPNMAASPMAGLATSINPGSDLASLFECPVCFDYVLPPILQVRKAQFPSISPPPPVSRRPPGLLQLPAQADLLPHLPRTAGRQYQEPRHGEGEHYMLPSNLDCTRRWPPR